MRLPRSGRPSPLTASASRVRNLADAEYARRLNMPWQLKALYYTDAVGELHYASSFYARMLQKLRIYPAKRVDDDTSEAIDSGLPVDLMNRIQDPGGGRTGILGAYGRLMFITGEGYLFGRNLGVEDERWSFVWREELRFDDRGKVTHVLSPSVPYVEFDLLQDDYFEQLPPDTAVAYRMWTPHPRFSAWPDSPMRASLEEAEELLVLSRSVLATATSRLVRSPLLVIPEEISPAPPQADGDEDPLNDPFLRDITTHFTRAIENPAAAESLAPVLLYAAAEWAERIKPIWLHNTDTDYLERDLRTECIRRLARSLDLPPEVVEGMSNANHWAAWWISDDMWRSHGAPKAEQFCDDLAEAYLRPALREAGYDGWDQVVVAYDASGVVVNPDRSKDADQAADRGMVSDEGYRVMKNIPEDYAPSVEEKQIWAATKKVQLDDQGEVIATPGRVSAEGGGTTAINPGDQPGTPDGQPGAVSEGTNLPASAARFQGAVEMQLLRCRELAGSRLRSRKDMCPDCWNRSSADEVPNSMLASALGQEGMLQIGNPDPRSLVAGSIDGFRTLLLSWDYEREEADSICHILELHAARTLLHKKPKIPVFHMVP